MNSKAKELYLKRMGEIMKGTLPFDAKKPTIVLTKKPEPVKKIYYKKAIV